MGTEEVGGSAPGHSFAKNRVSESSPGNVGRATPSMGLGFLISKIRGLEMVSTTLSGSATMLSTVN